MQVSVRPREFRHGPVIVLQLDVLKRRFVVVVLQLMEASVQVVVWFVQFRDEVDPESHLWPPVMVSNLWCTCVSNMGFASFWIIKNIGVEWNETLEMMIGEDEMEDARMECEMFADFFVSIDCLPLAAVNDLLP